MNTRFYEIMVVRKDASELSIRAFAKRCGVSYSMLIEFFDVDRPFRPMRSDTMAKFMNALQIEKWIIEEYNRKVIRDRKLKGE